MRYRIDGMLHDQEPPPLVDKIDGWHPRYRSVRGGERRWALPAPYRRFGWEGDMEPQSRYPESTAKLATCQEAEAMTEEKTETDPTWGFEGDSMEVRVARAMYGSAVERVRQHAAELDLQPERLRRVFKTARSEADRSAAILVFALAEDLMLDAIKRYLNADVRGGWAEVTSGNGLLATANDRITLLCLLRWIHPSVYADLRLLKSIRNRFAHHAEVSSFDDSVIRNWIGAISHTEASALAAVTRDGTARLSLTLASYS